MSTALPLYGSSVFRTAKPYKESESMWHAGHNSDLKYISLKANYHGNREWSGAESGSAPDRADPTDRGTEFTGKVGRCLPTAG